MRPVMSQTRLYDPTLGLKPALVSSYRHVVAMVTVTTAGTAASKVLFRGSAQENIVNFAAAATAANFHTTIQAKNLSDGTSINGSVGVPVDALGVTFVELNTNMLSWLGADITGINAAVFTIDVVATGGDE